ncbi:MAG: hypothetical protein J6X33_02210 [Clostridiales bacterium]|nr:hypothetical protein [Clostridiales bacterium]
MTDRIGEAKKVTADKLDEVIGGYAIRKADGEFFLLNTKNGCSIASVYATAGEACAARDLIVGRA